MCKFHYPSTTEQYINPNTQEQREAVFRLHKVYFDNFLFPNREHLQRCSIFVNRMRNIIALKTLREHWEKSGREDSEEQLKAWYHEAKQANWQNPNEVKLQYRSASIVGDNRIVFNICGNKYRLVVKINYEAQWIFIRFVGTHKEYDKIDVTSI